MEPESLDVEKVMDARRKAVEQSIREISIEELKSLGESLFSYVDHPWYERLQRFIDENAGATFYHATTNDRIQLLYCRSKEKGIWFIPGGAIGILQTRGLSMMKEIVDAR